MEGRVTPEEQLKLAAYNVVIKNNQELRAIIRELLTLKWYKDTFGKTPEYLERQPKAWEKAMEAVK